LNRYGVSPTVIRALVAPVPGALQKRQKAVRLTRSDRHRCKPGVRLAYAIIDVGHHDCDYIKLFNRLSSVRLWAGKANNPAWILATGYVTFKAHPLHRETWRL
jgi:hypothetical protein